MVSEKGQWVMEGRVQVERRSRHEQILHVLAVNPVQTAPIQVQSRQGKAQSLSVSLEAARQVERLGG